VIRLIFGMISLRPGRKICVNNQHVVLENHPAVIAVAFAGNIPLVEINVRREVLDFVHFSAVSEARREKKQTRDSERRIHRRILRKPRLSVKPALHPRHCGATKHRAQRPR
jgi:hypothetical protein